MSNITLSSSAMLVDLSISLWAAKKLDKKVSTDVDISNSTRTKAGNYHKNLLAGDDSLFKIQQLVTYIRNYHINLTVPWSDNGTRLLPTALFFEYKQEMAKLEQQYWGLVNTFIPEYSLKISAAAFQLGSLFNRDEYPCEDKVRTKFGFNLRYTPVPESGDFRVDVGNEGLEDLKARYEEQYAYNIQKVNDDAWHRLYDSLSKLSFGLRLEDESTGQTRGKIYASVLDNAKELTKLLTCFNVTGDTQMEEMRVRLESALFNLEVGDLKKSDYARIDLKNEVDAMLDKWN